MECNGRYFYFSMRGPYGYEVKIFDDLCYHGSYGCVIYPLGVRVWVGQLDLILTGGFIVLGWFEVFTYFLDV